MSESKIPVSVIVVTKNEQVRIQSCLDALRDFDEVLVVDSGSRDQTVAIAEQCGAQVISFIWNGVYPKKRQWCLDMLTLKHDWVFFVDADEIVTPELIAEIRHLFFNPLLLCAGYFITGRYRMNGRVLQFGLPNRKIALFDRSKMMFPVVDDLDLSGMGEIEGHYQPVLKSAGFKIGTLKAWLWHDAMDDERAWAFRHEKYARWEAGMNKKNAWPVDPVKWRDLVKRSLRLSQFRAEFVFLTGFLLKSGFLDGKYGLKLAVSKYKYYKYINYITENIV